MGKSTGRGHYSLGGDPLSCDVHKTHGVADHPGIGEIKEPGDRPIGGNTAPGDLSDNVVDQVDGGCLPFSGGIDDDETFFFSWPLLFSSRHAVKIEFSYIRGDEFEYSGIDHRGQLFGVGDRRLSQTGESGV